VAKIKTAFGKEDSPERPNRLNTLFSSPEAYGKGRRAAAEWKKRARYNKRTLE
jgi:hypothetical protein